MSRVGVLAVIAVLASCRDRDRDRDRDREASRHDLSRSESDPCGAQPTLIVTAMQSELDPVLTRTKVSTTVDERGEQFVCGTFAGRKVALAVVGIGPARASHGTALALDRFHASAIVMVGIAGGLSHDLRIGDVTVPGRWSRHDADPQWFAVDAALLERASASANTGDAAVVKLTPCDEPQVCATTPKLAIGGSGVTGRHFVEDPTVGAELEKRLGAVVTDMETAVVAQIAHDRGVPFIALRAVSDLVWTGRSDQLVERFGDLAADNAAAAAEAVLRQ